MKTIVSIRVPPSLVSDLQAKVRKNHFLDTSDAIRSIVRRKWAEWKDPTAYQIKLLRKEIKESVKSKSKETKQETILNELEKIRTLFLEND